MKIRDGIKFGIGLMIVKILVYGVERVILNRAANDDEYMERLKKDKPDHYEYLLKYRKN